MGKLTKIPQSTTHPIGDVNHGKVVGGFTSSSVDIGPG